MTRVSVLGFTSAIPAPPTVRRRREREWNTRRTSAIVKSRTRSVASARIADWGGSVDIYAVPLGTAEPKPTEIQ